MSKKVKICLFCEQEKVIVARGWCRSCYSRWQKTGSVEYKRKAEKKRCIVDDCDGFAVSHGYCDKHRKRLAVHGSLEPTRPNDWGKREKHPLYSTWCNQRRFRKNQLCKEWFNDFWRFVDDVGCRPSENHYFRPIDNDCELGSGNFHWVEKASSKTQEQKDYLKEWARKDRLNNPRKYKDKSLKKQYGIGIDDFDRMMFEQDGKCKICNNPETALDPRTKEPRGLAVDHCHNKGHVRALLCSACNTAIGLMKDDPEILQKAIKYLETH